MERNEVNRMKLCGCRRTAWVCLAAACWMVTCAAGAASADDFSWQRAHAEVLPTGDLKWQPEPFTFEKGASVRYIDFENGDDANDGTTGGRAWKHHPWDRAATGKAAACKGVHTYVFKRGVVYRGSLVAGESGKPGNPIRLTSDPAWGRGEAMFYGSETVSGWENGADHADIPQKEEVWHADLDFAPRSVWMVEDDKITRIPLARTPNWTVSDPDDVKSEWWAWENPQWWKQGFHSTAGEKGQVHLGIDTRRLTESADYYQDAIVWSEWGIVMGTPFPSRVEVVDTAQKGVGFQGVWYGESGKIIRGNRYYLEDKPHYLDSAGEFWFDRKGRGGRLYVRLPGDRDPSSVQIEAASRTTLIDSSGMSHVHVSGLTFRFTNSFWDLTARFFVHKEVDAACVRLLGSGEDVRISHCRFEHVNKAVRIKAAGDADHLDHIGVTDNVMAETDHGAIDVADSSRWGKAAPPFGTLGRVEVLRNSLRRIGLRPIRSGHGHAIVVNFPETAEIAGNMLDRCYGAGLFIFGGKGSGQLRDRPFCRILIHHNKVTDPLLNTNDWGGIETWQGGPFYVFNNICGNPGGYWHWHYKPDNPGSARFGFAYYLDGSFKNYHFNNIAWGKSKDPASRLGNTAAFQEIHSYQNTFFNNTVYNFVKGTRRQAPHAGRDKFLGNVWQGIGDWTFWHASPAKSLAEGNAADAGPQKEHFAHEKNAYAQNIFSDVSDKFGVFEPSGRWHSDMASFSQALDEHKALSAGVGLMAEEPILRDAARYDFRLAQGSPAADRGVKVFVPWALHAVVGEWHFCRSGHDPTIIMDEHWCMTPYHVGRGSYYTRPMYPLRAVNVSADDYVQGDLEDWTAGALNLNGKDQYAFIANAELTKPYDYEVAYQKDGKRVKENRTASGADLRTADVHTSNFLLEVYFRTEQGHTGGVLVRKMSNAAGYALTVNDAGGVSFAVKGGNAAAEVAGRTAVNNGRWYHVLAEADRNTKRLTIYVGGKQDAGGPGVDASVSLANNADLYVGGTPAGDCLASALEFVRISRGTLKDAKTTIEELYAWQFEGPQFRDFLGREPVGKRDAGAIESGAK